MLLSIESQIVPLPEHLVVFDTSPAAVLKAQATWLRAYDPYLPVVPRALLPWHALTSTANASDPEWWVGLIGRPSELLKTAAQKILDLRPSMPGLMPTAADPDVLGEDAVAVLAAHLPFTARLPRSVERLSRQPSALNALTTMEDGTAWEVTGLLSPSKRPSDAASEAAKTEYAAHTAVVRGLMQLTLWLRTNAILASDWLIGDIQAPLGVQKETYATVERASRFAHAMYWLADQMTIFHLREEARFLQQPVVQALLVGLAPHAREELAERTTRLLAEPLHPYLAMAERLLIPTRRYTRFGTANVTLGATRGGLWRRIVAAASATEKGQASRLDLVDLAVKMVDGDARSVLPRLQARELRMGVLNPDHLTQARSLFGATSTGGPAEFHLFGQAYSPYITDGVNINRAPADPLSLLTTDVLRLGTPTNPDAFAASLTIARRSSGGPKSEALPASAKAGVKSALAAYPGSWRDLDATVITGLCFVEPELPETDAAYALSILSASMLRPMTDKEYYGDADAILIPNDAVQIARALGRPDEDAKLPEFLASIEHLRDGDGKPLTQYAFHSTRTRQPWLKPVELTRAALPTHALAVSDRAGAVLVPVEAAVNIVPERTVLAASVTPTTDTAARAAALQGQ